MDIFIPININKEDQKTIFKRLEYIMQEHATPHLQGKRLHLNLAIEKIFEKESFSKECIEKALYYFSGCNIIILTEDKYIQYGVYYWKAVLEASPLPHTFNDFYCFK